MDATDKPIARWLRVSRESQRMEDADGNSVEWTHKHLLARMLAEIGWAPPHSNYSKYESGKSTPNPTTLKKFERFWKAHGIDGPDLSPVKAIEPEPTLAQALSDLAAELAAVRQEREAWERGVLAVLRSFRDGQVPVELLDALAPQPLEDAQP